MKKVRLLVGTRKGAFILTSDEARDAWFLGFTPTLAAGVWVGFDNNDKTKPFATDSLR